MKKLLALLVVAALSAPAAARADGSIQLNLRGSYGIPGGNSAGTTKLADAIEYAIPLQADLQFRILKPLSVGGYFRYDVNGVAKKAKDACDLGGATSCKSDGIAFGAVTEYRFSPRLEGGGWVGAQAGYQILNQKTKTATASATAKTTGYEAGVSAGWDAELGGLTLGPWVWLDAGQFQKYDLGDGTSGSVSQKKLHYLFGVGLRASLLL